MTDNSVLFKTNFALNASVVLDLIPFKFFEVMQWVMQNSEDTEEYKVPTKYFFKIAGSAENSHSKRAIKKTLEQLLTTKVQLNEGKYLGFEACCFISYMKIEQGNIIFSVAPQLKQWLLAKNHCQTTAGEDGYNKFDLAVTKLFKSKYSLKLYQYFLMKKNTSNLEYIDIPISELRKYSHCVKSYKEYKEYNKSVLKVAIAEINALSDLDVEYSSNERNATHLRIKITKLKQARASIKAEIPKVIHSIPLPHAIPLPTVQATPVQPTRNNTTYQNTNQANPAWTQNPSAKAPSTTEIKDLNPIAKATLEKQAEKIEAEKEEIKQKRSDIQVFFDALEQKDRINLCKSVWQSSGNAVKLNKMIDENTNQCKEFDRISPMAQVYIKDYIIKQGLLRK